MRGLKCEYCSKTYPNKSNLNEHVRDHLGQKRHKCSFCPYATNKTTSLACHIRTHTKEKPYECLHPNCAKSYAQKESLRLHQLVHNDEIGVVSPSFGCPVDPECPFKTKWESSAKSHVKTHSNDRPFPCDLCPYRAKIKSKLTEHRRDMHEVKQLFNCPQPDCSFSTVRKSTLNVHMRSIHWVERPFSCSFPECTYRARRKDILKNHELTHDNEKPLKCTLCPYTCNRHYNLVVHVRGHTGETPYHCSSPGCFFKAKSSKILSKHAQIWHRPDEKPFACSFSDCKYNARERSCLRTHERIHRGDKPFKCTFCPYSATQSCALTAHIRVHTGETPFQCQKCTRQYKTSANPCTHLNKCKKRNNLDRGRKDKRLNNVSNTSFESSSSVYKCKVASCDFSTRDNAELANHLNIAHNLPRIVLYV